MDGDVRSFRAKASLRAAAGFHRSGFLPKKALDASWRSRRSQRRSSQRLTAVLASALSFGSVVLLWCSVGAPWASANSARVSTFNLEVRYTPGLIYWIDNRLLVLKAIPAEPTIGTNYSASNPGRFAVLDTFTGKLKWGEPFAGRLCVNGRALAFWDMTPEVGGTRRFYIAQGTVDQIAKREVAREDLNGDRFDFEYSCAAIAELPRLPLVSAGTLIKRLRPEDGFVELNKPLLHGISPLYPVAFYRRVAPERAIGIEILQGADIESSWPYFSFKRAYWLGERISQYPPKPPGTYKSWWLYPDGRVLPAMEFNLSATFDGVQSWVPTIPVRDGFLGIRERGRRSPGIGNLGNAGLYRFDAKGKHEKLISGTVRPWVVSPDGCKVALGNDDRPDDAGTERLILKIVEVCQ